MTDPAVDLPVFEELDPSIIGALSGLGEGDDHLLRLARGLVDASFEQDGMSEAMQTRVYQRLDLIQRDPITRILTRLAKAASIPYSEARERWSDPDDLAHEIASTAIDQADHLRRCPNCGTDPTDYQDPTTKRPLQNPAIGLDMWDCFMCQQIAQKRRLLDEDAKERGTDIRVMPRAPGEQFYRGGDIAD